MANRPLLEIRHLSVSYQTNTGIVRALRNVSVEIFEGETLSLVGETGSGKSTLAHAILGLLDRRSRWESGEIFLEGRSLSRLKQREWKSIRSRKIGIVFQDMRSALNPVLTIGSHLIETLRAHQPLSRKQARRRALELLQEVGLPEGHARLYAHELSGGECQRVGIALGICNHPKLLIADEPTSAVDSTLQAQILDLLQSMKQRHKLAVLLISHDLALVSQISDRIVVMYYGSIAESGLAHEVIATPAHPYTIGLIRCYPDPSYNSETAPLTVIPGSAPEPEDNIAGCAFAPRCAHRMPQCLDSTPPAHEISKTHWAACFRSYGTGTKNTK